MPKKVYDDQKGARDEWAKMKTAPLSKKLEYLLTYYGTVTFVTVAVVLAVAFTVPACVANNRPLILSGEFLHHGPEEDAQEAFKSYLCEELGLDPEKNRLDIANRLMDTEDGESMMTYYEVLAARIMAKDLDFYCAAEDELKYFMNTEDLDSCCFGDLRDFVPEDILSSLESSGKLLYYTLDDGTTFPFAIDPSGTELSEMLGLYSSDGCIAIVINTERTDAVAAMCRLLVPAE